MSYVTDKRSQQNNISSGRLPLVGGFNPCEKYWSKRESSPCWGENKKSWKPPPSPCLVGAQNPPCCTFAHQLVGKIGIRYSFSHHYAQPSYGFIWAKPKQQ